MTAPASLCCTSAGVEYTLQEVPQVPQQVEPSPWVQEAVQQSAGGVHHQAHGPPGQHLPKVVQPGPNGYWHQVQASVPDGQCQRGPGLPDH